MTGSVRNLQATLPVTFLSGNQSLAIEFVVDTGFAGALTLPLAAVKTMRLPFELELDSVLANGSIVRTQVFRAMILWQDQEVSVAVLALGERPLLGTALLSGRRLQVDFDEGGSVLVTPLPV
jgi:clan AA aspartic protease